MSEHNPYDLVAEQEREADRLSSSELAAKNADDDFLWLMSSERGRRVVRRLIETAGVFRSSFNSNAMQMANTEGRKQVGFWILEQIEKLCPKAYHTMMQEKKKNDT